MEANKAAAAGNNVTINTGPVTSHTVLLNLFHAPEDAQSVLMPNTTSASPA